MMIIDTGKLLLSENCPPFKYSAVNSALPGSCLPGDSIFVVHMFGELRLKIQFSSSCQSLSGVVK